MKRRHKIAILLISFLLVVPLCFLIVNWYCFTYRFGPNKASMDEQKQTLIYKTDHDALLKDCRRLMSEAKEGKWGSIRYYVKYPEFDSENEGMIRYLPKIILELKPAYIDIDEKIVIITIVGGMYHFGVVASYNDYLPGDTGFEEYYGNRKLTDGLWYYDDGYKHDPNYEEYIESLRPKSQMTDKPPPDN